MRFRGLRAVLFAVFLLAIGGGWLFLSGPSAEWLTKIGTVFGGFLVLEWLISLWLVDAAEYSEKALPSRPGMSISDWRWSLGLLFFGVGGWLTRETGWDDWGSIRYYLAAVTLPLLWKSAGIDFHYVWGKPLLSERVVIFGLWMLIVLWHPAFCGPFVLAALALYSRMGYPLELSMTDIVLPFGVSLAAAVEVVLLPALNLAETHSFLVIQAGVVGAYYLKPGIGKMRAGWHGANQLVNLSYAAEEQNDWNPFGAWLPTVRRLVSRVNPVLLLTTLFFEIGYCLALIHPVAWVGINALAFVFHFGVFALSGICFWKWQIVLAAIAVAGFSSLDFGWLAVAGALVVAVMYALLGRQTRALTWFDGPVSHRFEFRAVDDEEHRFRIPPEVLEPLGFTFAQGRFFCFLDRPVLHGCFGAVSNRKILKTMEKSETLEAYQMICQELGVNAYNQAGAERVLDVLAAYVRNRQSEKGRASWFRCPPHIFSQVPRPLWDIKRVTGLEVVYEEVLRQGEKVVRSGPAVVATRNLMKEESEL